MATRNATNYTEFAAALAASVSGDIVFIPEESQINMTGQSTRTIPAGVEIRGERGKPLIGGGRSLGGRIYSTTNNAVLFQTGGANCKIRLLRIEGNMPNTTNSGQSGFNPGIRVTQDGFLLEWCEVSGFAYAAVQVNYTNQTWRTRITRCYFHHCQHNGLGYSITINHGYYIVSFCKFSNYRHCVAGGGDIDSSAEVTDCLILSPNPAQYSHSFDMHSIDGDNRSNPGRAAKLLIYDRNVFGPRNPVDSEAHITVRGIPTQHLYIRDNKFWRTTISSALDCFGGESSNSYTTISGNTLNYNGPLVDPSDTDLFWGPPTPPVTTVTCTLTAPVTGTNYNAPASIALTATASSSGGSITSVVFKSGSNILGTGNLSGGVYSFSYTDVPVGTYNLSATATDNTGVIGSSAVSTVTVTAPPPPPTSTGWAFTRHDYILDKLSNFIKRAPYLFKK